MAYQVRVHDDGDTEIRNTGANKTADFSDDQYLTFEDVENLIKELIDYGHDEDRVNEAVDEMLSSDSNEWVEV